MHFESLLQKRDNKTSKRGKSKKNTPKTTLQDYYLHWLYTSHKPRLNLAKAKSAKFFCRYPYDIKDVMMEM